MVKDAGPVDPAEVNGLGFLLGDKKAGPFKLEVEWIKVVRARSIEVIDVLLSLQVLTWTAVPGE